MSLIATRLQNWRVENPEFDRNMARPLEYGALDFFIEQTNAANSIINPNLRDRAFESIGNTVQVPVINYDGEVTVLYKRTPQTLTNDIDQIIDIPDEYQHLLALLTAAYIWLDDDPTKAQYYMSLYREGMLAIRLYSRNPSNCEYHDVTGWA